ncbi:MAG: alpha/beta hydrolase [Bacteroidota bacterium]
MIITTKLGQIDYEERGQGYPVLCFHGGHSNCGDTLWHKGFDLRRFRLITPSRPGYGNTPLANFSQPERAAELVNALLDILGIKQLAIIGISAGGLTALAFAGQYPKRVEKLLLLSAVTRQWLKPQDGLYRIGKVLFSPQLEGLIWFMFRSAFWAVPRLMTSVLFNQLSSCPRADFGDQTIRELSEMTKKQRSGQGFSNDLDQQLNRDILTQIRCSTLVVHSKYDKSIPIGMANYAHEQIHGARLQLTDNKWGHLLWVGPESEEITRSIVDFITGEE